MPQKEKSPEAFRTISEVAEWLGVPTHVLRFWESRFTQVKPVKRAGGRRYYRPRDMELLGGIKKLLHDDGMTIRGVQKLLREEGVRHVAALSPSLIAGELSEGEVIELQPSKREPDTGANRTGSRGAPIEVAPEAPMAVDVPSEDDHSVVAMAPAPEPDSPPAATEPPGAQSEFALEDTVGTKEDSEPPDDPQGDAAADSPPDITGVARTLRQARWARTISNEHGDRITDIYERLRQLRRRMDQDPDIATSD